MKRMKSGKAVSLLKLLNISERIPEEWRRSELVPVLKNMADMRRCSIEYVSVAQDMNEVGWDYITDLL